YSTSYMPSVGLYVVDDWLPSEPKSLGSRFHFSRCWRSPVGNVTGADAREHHRCRRLVEVGRTDVNRDEVQPRPDVWGERANGDVQATAGWNRGRGRRLPHGDLARCSEPHAMLTQRPLLEPNTVLLGDVIDAATEAAKAPTQRPLMRSPLLAVEGFA